MPKGIRFDTSNRLSRSPAAATSPVFHRVVQIPAEVIRPPQTRVPSDKDCHDFERICRALANTPVHTPADNGNGMTKQLPASSSAPLSEFPSAPPQTRMLVCADGSTTVLLNALVGERLSIQVDQQQRVPAASVQRIGCQILGAAPGAPVVDRRSRILTSRGGVISVNHVVIAARGADGLVPPPEEFVGPYLKRVGLALRRELLAVSRGTWPLGPASDCLSKEYLIDCGDAGRMYVHERFNPRFVPLEQDG